MRRTLASLAAVLLLLTPPSAALCQTLFTWGWGPYGELGRSPRWPPQVGNDTDWAAVAAGENHTIAVKTDGTLWAWGRNAICELAPGDAATSSTPVRVGNDTNWAAIAAGEHHTLALKSDGTLWAWGYNGAGQLGLGDYGPGANHYTPTRVGTETNWTAIAGGWWHSLALKSDGTLWAWGSLPSRNLSIPTQVGTDTNWSAISAGCLYTVALKSDGTLWRWGSNPDPDRPTQVGTDADWAAVAGGGGHILALKSDGTLWAWGFNRDGQLGLGDTTDRQVPTQVGTDTHWAAVSAGVYDSFAIKTDGTLWAWGDNVYYQLGLPGDDRTVPTRAPAGLGGRWIAVSAGWSFTAALQSAPPVTTATVTGTTGANGWYRSDVTVTLSATDHSRTGIDFIRYRLDGEPFITVDGEAATLSVTGDGTHSLVFHAYDNAGYMGAYQTLSLKIDTVAPGPTSCTLSRMSATLSSSDATSGVASVSYSLDGGPETTCAGDIAVGLLPHTLSYHATDVAGNAEAPQTTSIPDRRTATKIWVVPVSGAIGGTVSLQAVLMDADDNRLIGKTLRFSVDGTEVAKGVTAAYGYANCSYTIPMGWTDSHTVTAAFADAGDPAYLTSSHTGTLTITADRATSIWAPAVSGALGDTVALQGCLYATNGGQKLSGQTLIFKVDGVTVGTGVTDGYGYAVCPYTLTSGTPGGSIGFTVEFAGVTGLAASSGISRITILALRQTTIYVVPVTAAGGTSTYLQACLYATKGYDRLIGKVLHFSLDGVPMGDATTAAWGYAALPITVPAGTGPLAIEVTYDGDGTTFTGATGHGTLTRP